MRKFKLDKVEVHLGRLTGPRDDLSEKDLDTKIASDLPSMAYENEFDTAIIVAGDGDYQSPSERVRGIDKKVEHAYFRNRSSMALRSACDLSRRLRQSYFIELPI